MWQLLSEPFGLRLSATLLHFVWQGAAVAAAAAVALRLLRSSAPHVRYAVAYGALMLMAAAPLVTWSFITLPTSADPLAAVAPIAQPTGVNTAAIDPSRRTAPSTGEVFSAAGQYDSAIDHRPTTVSAPPAERPLVDRLVARIAPLQPYLLGAWLAGVALCASRLLAGIAGIWWLRGGRSRVPVWLNVSLVRLGRRLGMNASGRVFASPRVDEAVAVGFWRPIVLVPMSWLTELPADMVEAIVAHELAHIRRFDLWAVFGQRLVETVLFYHPAIWWISRRVSTEREMCCDAVAVAATGERRTYVRALEAVGRRNASGRRKLVGSQNVSFALATSFRGEEDMVLLKRVRQVLGLRAQSEAGRAWPAGALVAGLALGAWTIGAGFGGSYAEADAPREGDKPKAEAGREGGDRPAAEGARREGDRPAAEGSRREGAAREGAAREGAARDGEPRREGAARDGERRPEGTPDGKPRREGVADGKPGPRGEDVRRNSEARHQIEDFKPQTDREEALFKMIIGLRSELEALRRQAGQGRGAEPRREGAREGGDRPAGAREGDRPAARDGERPSGAARDGERPKTGPRDGEGAPRTGPRDGERPAAGPRDGERRPEGAREGERRPAEGEAKPRIDG